MASRAGCGLITPSERGTAIEEQFDEIQHELLRETTLHELELAAEFRAKLDEE